MNPIYYFFWRPMRLFYYVYFRWQAFNGNRVPHTGGVIVASNHASFIDPLLVGSGVSRELCYLARESLFRLPGMGWLLRKLNSVPVDRDGGGGTGLKRILEQLLLGHGIVLFPEGTRTLDGRLQPARSGIGLTVIKSQAPVVPVRVFGSFEAYGKRHVFPRPRKIVVKYGRPMSFAALRAEAKTCSKPRLKQIYQQVADEIMTEIGRLEPCLDKDEFP